jgi:hypothetical protein
MILLGHTLSELRSQNRAARSRIAPRNKKSGLGTARTKKHRAKAPFQKVTVALARSIATRKLKSVATRGARGYMESLAPRVGTEVAKRGRL